MKTLGQTLTEYTLIVLCVALVAFGAYRLLGNNTVTSSNQINSELSNS